MRYIPNYYTAVYRKSQNRSGIKIGVFKRFLPDFAKWEGLSHRDGARVGFLRSDTVFRQADALRFRQLFPEGNRGAAAYVFSDENTEIFFVLSL